jgi:ferric enterobactin receptor
MKIKSFFFVFLLCFFFSGNLIGQTASLSKIKVTKTYSDYLDAVFLDIGTRYNVKFSYDWYAIHQISFNGSFNNAPLDSILNILCSKYNLKYHFDDNIVEIEKIKEETNSEFTEVTSGATEYNDKKIYFGDPKLFKFTLSGKVRDENTGEALPYAIIGIPGTSVSAVTNTDGYFTLLKIPSDTSTLTISYMGYKTRKFYLTPETQRENLIIELLAASTNLSAVEIKGERLELMRVASAEISTVKLSPQKIATLPNIGEKDIMRSFQLMPGVSSSNETSSGLYVRGGTPDQNLILYDGFTVYQVDHLYGFFSAFNSNAIKDIQLYKGGFESKFGGRLSSVTEITAKEGNQKNFNIGGDLSLLSANAYMEIPMGKKITFFVAGRKSYKGPLYNKIFKEFNNQGTTTETNAPANSHMPSGTETTVKSFFYDLNSKLTYKPSSKDIIALSFYNGTDKLDNSRKMSTPSFLQDKGIDLSSSTSDLTKYGNLGGAVKWSRKWSNNFYGNTLISYSNYYSNRNRTGNTAFKGPGGDDKNMQSGILENNNLKDYGFKSDYQWDILKDNKIEFGCFATYNDIHYSFSQNDTTTYLNRQDYGSVSGGYVQDNFKFFDSKLSLVPGVRLTYFNITNKVYSEPRFSINYNITDKLQLKFATGRYYQFVNRVEREDIMTGSRDFWILSDRNKVPVGEAIHYIIGTSYDTKNYLYSVEAYYKDLKGLTEYSIRFKPQVGSGGYSENFFNGNGIAKGIEFLAQKKSGKLNGWVSYTLGQALDYFPVYSDKYFPASQDVTHEFKIVSMYKWKRWDFSATWIFATGRPYTAPEGGYQLTLLDGTASNYITVGEKNSLRLPNYHRLDIAANYNFFNSRKKAVGYIGISIFNVYNRKNVWYKEYKIAEGYVVETNINYLGITPNLTLSFKLR